MDGLSSASAVIAVGSVAIQLAETIHKLHVFWKAIQDAPSDITELFNELESLLDVLDGIRGTSQSEKLGNSSNRVLTDCQDKVLRLQEKLLRPLSEFRSSSNCKRKWGALKITLKKPFIESTRASIEKAKTALLLAQVNLIHQHLRDQNQVLVGISQTVNVRATSTTIVNCSIDTPAADMQIKCPLEEIQSLPTRPASNAISKSLVVESYEVVNSSSMNLPTPLWSVSTRSTTRKVVKKHASGNGSFMETGSSYILYPSKLLGILGVSFGISIQTRSMSGWQFSLQPFTAVPSTAPIFEFCRDGNVAGIRTLLSCGHASLRDRDPDGRTPLWIAAQSLQHEAARFLLEQGADAQSCDWNSRCPPMSAVRENSEVDIHKKMSVVNLLMKHSPDGYDEDTVAHLVGRLLLFYRIQKQMKGFSSTNKRDAALEIIKQLLPHFPPEDFGRTRVLQGAIQFHFDQSVLRWTLGNIKGMLHDTPMISVLHEAISHNLLQRDPLSVRMISAKTQNLHRYWCPDFPSTVPASTPTSLAMYQRAMFLPWVSILRNTEHDIDQFVKQELEEGNLAQAGWKQETLMMLFGIDSDYVPGTRKTEFLHCERCGKWDCSEKPMIDLDWRRQLRDLRLGRCPADALSQTSTNAKITNIAIVLNDHSHIEEPPIPESNPLKILSPNMPSTKAYNIVCSDRGCEDGECVAWIYENNSLDEPDRPPYMTKEMRVNVSEIHDASGKESWQPRSTMPGTFQD